MPDSVAIALKVVIILALAPIWMPVLKALYDDFEAALWREGGLFGRPPSGDELAELEQKYRSWKSPLINEPLPPRRGSKRR